MRWIVCFVVWMLAGLVAALATVDSKLGPVVARVSQNHGVHAGDVVIWAGAIMVSATITSLAWITRPNR